MKERYVLKIDDFGMVYKNETLALEAKKELEKDFPNIEIFEETKLIELGLIEHD